VHQLHREVAEQRSDSTSKSVADLVHWTTSSMAHFMKTQDGGRDESSGDETDHGDRSAPDSNFAPQLIPLLATKSLGDILEEPFVAPLLPPLLKTPRTLDWHLKERAECKDATIFFDVTDQDLEGYNKFVPYYLHPESIYSVGLSKSSFRVKVSVGSNPWATTERQ